MTIKELMEELKKLNPKSMVVIASDEEFNNIFKDVKISPHFISDYVVMFGLSGTELLDCYGCDRLFSENDLIASVWDNHSYCSKCLDELDEEYTKDGYTYDADNDEVKDKDGNIINV